MTRGRFILLATFAQAVAWRILRCAAALAIIYYCITH